VVLATPWSEFAALALDDWIRPAPPRLVIDCWRVLGHLRDSPRVDYLALGFGKGFA